MRPKKSTFVALARFNPRPLHPRRRRLLHTKPSLKNPLFTASLQPTKKLGRPSNHVTMRPRRRPRLAPIAPEKRKAAERRRVQRPSRSSKAQPDTETTCYRCILRRPTSRAANTRTVLARRRRLKCWRRRSMRYAHLRIKRLTNCLTFLFDRWVTFSTAPV